MKVGGAGGTRTPDPLHAMQVLSQLSYNPTIGPLIGAAIGRHPGRYSRLLGGRVRVPAIAGLHHPGSLRIAADAYCSRVNAFRAGVYQPTPIAPTWANQSHARPSRAGDSFRECSAA